VLSGNLWNIGTGTRLVYIFSVSFPEKAEEALFILRRKIHKSFCAEDLFDGRRRLVGEATGKNGTESPRRA